MNTLQTYTKIFTKRWFVILLLLVSVGANGCDSCDGSAGPITDLNTTELPAVSSTIPASGDIDVPLNQMLTVSFNREMNVASINDLTFTVTGIDTASVVGSVALDETNKIATFTPSTNLDANTTYTATMAAEAEDLDANVMVSNYVWEFTTGSGLDVTAPTVLSTIPANAETDVLLNQNISVTFNETINPLSVTTLIFVVTGPDATPVAGIVSLDATNTVATFTPDAVFNSNATYTATMTTGAEDLAGNALSSDYIWNFTTGVTTGIAADSVAPTVLSTSPADAVTGVAINQAILATFSEVMNPATLSTLSFVVNAEGGSQVAGSVVIDATNTIATYIPDTDLAVDTNYSATITTEAKDLAGNAMANNYVWAFSTGAALDTSAIYVSSTAPADAEIDVLTNRSISITFSEAFNPLTVTGESYAVTGPGLTPVLGSIALDASNTIATFTPDSVLEFDTLYTATASTAVEDLAGNPLVSNYVWEFTTGSMIDVTAPMITATNPADADISVALNKSVTASFSEAMDDTTITTDTYLITLPDLTPVLGVVSYDLVSHVATFTPDSDLAPSTTYTAMITIGAKDSAGNALESDVVWNFTTGIEAAQIVEQVIVPLGSSSNFAILASAAITNIATSAITGDVGLTPDAGSNISGFNDPANCPEVIGNMYAVDATGPACALISPSILSDAKNDAEVAFINARAAVRGTPQAIAGNLNGLTLYPGLYESGSSLEISPAGFLYLDAQGDVNAIFIIRSETSITTEASSEVVLTKGAQAKNVYWTAGSTVTLGTNSIMKGTMVAGTSISLLTGANLEGRALNQGPAAEAITLDSCTITVPSP